MLILVLLCIILIAIFVLLSIYLIIQIIKCNKAVKESKNRLLQYGAKTAILSYGKMNYVDKGSNDENIILSVHGIFGGYDQGYDAYKDFRDSSDSNNNNNNNNNNNYRIIAPSRFGYLGSDIMGNGTPKEQAKAYIELLNNLKIDKVFVLATSAGGSPAIRFALDYPERVKGLILYCSAMPFYEKPKKIIKYAGPPPFICNNFLMFLMKPLFKLIMGMEPSTIYSILPINDRKNGVIIDASITNLDMAKNYDEYAVEKLKVPTIVFQAKDDKLINYIDTEKSIKRFPNCTFISFENGGHLMTGHEEEIRKEVSKFVSTYH